MPKAKKQPEQDARQESLMDLLKEENIEFEYNPAVSLSAINRPTDAVMPSADFIAGVKKCGFVYEPPILQRLPRGRFNIASGRRRYLALDDCGITTTHAIITNLSKEQYDVLTMKLNRQRSENLLADVQAMERLLERGYTEEEIASETGLSKGEIDRRRRFALSNPGIRKAMLEGKCAVSVGEAASKLPPGQQKALVEQFAASDAERLTMEFVKKAKEVRAAAAIAALPQILFNGPELNGNADGAKSRFAPNAEPTWLNPCALSMWETLQELERSGALTGRRTKESSRAMQDALHIIDNVRQAEAASNGGPRDAE